MSWRGVPVRFGSQSPPSEGTEALQTAGPAVWSMPGQLPQGHNEDRTQSQRAHTPAPILPCWAKTRGREGARNGQPLAHGSSRAFSNIHRQRSPPAGLKAGPRLPCAALFVSTAALSNLFADLLQYGKRTKQNPEEKQSDGKNPKNTHKT